MTALLIIFGTVFIFLTVDLIKTCIGITQVQMEINELMEEIKKELEEKSKKQ